MSTWMGDSIWGINFYASFSRCPSLKYTGQSGLTLRVIYLFEKIKCIAKFNQFQNQDFVGIKKITKQISVSTLAKTIHRDRFANVWKKIFDWIRIVDFQNDEKLNSPTLFGH